MHVIDLSIPLTSGMPVYTQAAYADPPVRVRTWCSVAEQGYWVSQVCMGTQTGTHIDAPAHFHPGGACLDALPVQSLAGPFTAIDVRRKPLELPDNIAQIPLLDARGGASLAVSDLETLVALKRPLWVLAGEVDVKDAPPLAFHRRIAQAGIYLVEELDPAYVAPFPRTGELIALPLALVGTSGAPCRVLLKTQ